MEVCQPNSVSQIGLSSPCLSSTSRTAGTPRTKLFLIHASSNGSSGDASPGYGWIEKASKCPPMPWSKSASTKAGGDSASAPAMTVADGSAAFAAG